MPCGRDIVAAPSKHLGQAPRMLAHQSDSNESSSNCLAPWPPALRYKGLSVNCCTNNHPLHVQMSYTYDGHLQSHSSLLGCQLHNSRSSPC